MKSRFVQNFSLRCKVKGTVIELVIIRTDDNAIELHHIKSDLLKERSEELGASTDDELVESARDISGVEETSNPSDDGDSNEEVTDDGE